MRHLSPLLLHLEHERAFPLLSSHKFCSTIISTIVIYISIAAWSLLCPHVTFPTVLQFISTVFQFISWYISIPFSSPFSIEYRWSTGRYSSSCVSLFPQFSYRKGASIALSIPLTLNAFLYSSYSCQYLFQRMIWLSYYV